jgi:GH15 family glucan-1,4-alpha-glucosidase
VTTTPIADYALLSDRHSAALVSLGGAIDWLCFPRFDSPSTFGRLFDENAGHWFFGATDATEVSRRYLDCTMVLETTLRTPTGSGQRSEGAGDARRDRGAAHR